MKKTASKSSPNERKGLLKVAQMKETASKSSTNERKGLLKVAEMRAYRLTWSN